MKLNELTIEQARVGLAKKEFTSAELTEACLARISAVDPKVKAFITVTADLARKQAAAEDARIAAGTAGELTGIPIAIKDNMLVDGVQMTSGSKILEKYIATYDATVIKKLKDAGAVLVGKTNMDEFAMGSSTENSAFFKTHNPWDLDRVPGGSSGGSASAVAADMCLAALGSDTGSSIRQPAALCGVVGLKPTYSTVSRFGLSAMASSLDQIGPITKTVADAARLYRAIAGADGHDLTVTQAAAGNVSLDGDLKGKKVGVPEEYFMDGMDPAVQATVEAAIAKLKDLGAKIVQVSLPSTKYSLAVYIITVVSEISANLARFDGIRYGPSANAEAKDLLEVYMQTRDRWFGDESKRRIILGTFALSSGYYDQYYAKAQKVRAVIRKEYLAVFKKVDLLATPTSPSVAFKLGEKFADPLMMYLSDVYNTPANIAGICALSVPCGFAAGLPVGLQLMAKPFDEQMIFQAAHQYEQATDWHRQRPNLH